WARSVRERVPKRCARAVQPAGAPGTVAEPTPRNGTSPASGGVAAGKRPLELSPASSPSTHTMARRSPPTPHMWGYATARARLVAIAASAALPPSRRTSSPIRDARVSGEQTAWRAKRGTGRSAAQRPEEGADVVDQRDRLLHGREVSAALEARPARDVVETLDPRARRLQDLLREDRAAGRDVHPEGLRWELPGVHHLVVEPRRRRRRLRHPVEHHVGEQLVLREAPLDVAVAVAPRAELLDDPGAEPGWGVVQRVAERLRLRALDALVARLLA